MNIRIPNKIREIITPTKLRWGWILTTSLLVFGLFLYTFNNSILYLVEALAIVEIILSVYILGRKRKNIAINVPRILTLFILCFLLLSFLYSLYFFNVRLTQPLNIETYAEVFRSVFYSLTSLILGVFIFLAYLIVLLPSGSFLTSLILGDSFKKLSLLEKYSYSFLMGMLFIGFVFFFLAGYSNLTLPFMLVIFLLSGIAFIYKFNSSRLIRNIKNAASWKISLELSPAQVGLGILSFLFIAGLLIFFLQTLPAGPDGLRVYLNLIKGMTNSARLPETSATLLFPFITELLFVPAFKIGGSIEANFILKVISLHFLIPIFLICKHLFRGKKFPFWIFLVAILFPSYLRIFIGEFKIDIIASFVQFTFIYLLLEYKENKNIRFVYLASLFLGYAILIKLTSLFFVLPFILIVIYAQYKFKTKVYIILKKTATILIIISLPVFLWSVFYRFQLPYIGNLGLGLLPVSREQPPKMDLSQCIASELTLEQEAYYGLKPGLAKYFYLFVIYAMPTKGSLTLALGEAGIWISTLVPLSIFLALKKRVNFQFTSSTIILTIAILSLIPVLILTPILTWYAATSYMLIYLVAAFYLSKTQISQILKNFVVFIIIMYMNTFIIVDGFANYVSPISIKQPDEIKDMPYKAYNLDRDMSEVVNVEKGNILFSSSASFANINYFIDNYFDRSVYFDRYTSSYDEAAFENLNRRYNFKYFIFHKDGSNSSIKCMTEINNKIKKDIFDKYGEKVFENESYVVYKNLSRY